MRIGKQFGKGTASAVPTDEKKDAALAAEVGKNIGKKYEDDSEDFPPSRQVFD